MLKRKKALCFAKLLTCIIILYCFVPVSCDQTSGDGWQNLPLKWKGKRQDEIDQQSDSLSSSNFQTNSDVKFTEYLPGWCPQGQYWVSSTSACRPCDVCTKREVEIEKCSVSRNSICLSKRDVRKGKKCLWTVPVENKLSFHQTEWNDQNHPCYTKYTRLVASYLRRYDYKRSVKQPQKNERTTEKIVSVSTTNTFTLLPTPSTTPDTDEMAHYPVFSSNTFHRKSSENNKAKPKKLDNPKPTSEPKKLEPVSGHDGNMLTFDDHDHDGHKESATIQTPTHKANNIDHKPDKESISISSAGDSDKAGPTGVEEDDNDNKDNLFDLEWLYTAIGAVILILAVSIFLATRLQAKRNAALPTKRSMDDKSSPDGIKKDVIEMDDLEGQTQNCRKLSSSRDLSQTSPSQICPADEKVQIISENSMKDLKSSNPHLNPDWLKKTNELNAQNVYGLYHSEAETQTEIEVLPNNSRTVFRTPWQFSGTFSADGGVLQRENSDVALIVGKDAVLSGNYVTISGAIFTDATVIRKKFDLPSNEMLITPLVEYHAEGSYQFHQHVSVKLPHALPEDFDISFVKFYTFSVDECGNVVLTLLPLKSKDNSNTDAYWDISSQEQCFIAKTTHFSGYFCTSCESKTKLPSVYARVFGSHVQIKSNRKEIRLILYIWDRRLNIKDFIEAVMQQECDMDRQLLADEPVPLLENASSDSSIVMRMETLGDALDQQCWRHVARSNASRPLFRPLQIRKLRQIVLCCQQSDPMRIEWALENVPETCPSPVFQCLIEIVHVPEGETNNEEAFQNADEEYIKTFYIRNLKLSKDSLIVEPKSKEECVKKTLSRIIDRPEMESICGAFGISKKDIGNLSKKFNTEDALKEGLLEECSRKCGEENFVRILPHVLQQTHLKHAMDALQSQHLLSSLSTTKSGHPSTGCREYQDFGHIGRVENTVCKSLASCCADSQPARRHSPSYQRSNSLKRFDKNHNQDNNTLRLNISPESNIQNESQISPDSDYGSPQSREESELMDSSCEIGGGLVWMRKKQPASSNGGYDSVSGSGLYTTSDDYTSNPDLDFDSCLATVDSEDLQEAWRGDSTDNTTSSSLVRDSNCVLNVDSQDVKGFGMSGVEIDNREQTFIKEMALLNHQSSRSSEEAHPEILNEQTDFHSGPGALLGGCPNHAVANHDSLSPHSSCVSDETFRKEIMFV